MDPTRGCSNCCRRAPHIRRPLSSIVRRSSSGAPYLAPEIQLLYKTRSARSRDQHDFDAVIPSLDEAACLWLRSALLRADPGHRWIGRLDDRIMEQDIRPIGGERREGAGRMGNA